MDLLQPKHMAHIFIIAGLIPIVAAVALAYDTQRKIENWLEIEGTVLDAWVVQKSGSGTSQSGGSGPHYQVQAMFTYESAGNIYRSTIALGSWRSGIGAEAAKVREAESMRGQTRMLSVNPSNPDQFSLQLGYNLRSFMGSLILGGLGVFFALAGFLMRDFFVVRVVRQR